MNDRIERNIKARKDGSDIDVRFIMGPEGASGGFIARGLNDANMRWIAIGLFIVLSGIGVNQWASGIIRIVKAFLGD